MDIKARPMNRNRIPCESQYTAIKLLAM